MVIQRLATVLVWSPERFSHAQEQQMQILPSVPRNRWSSVGTRALLSGSLASVYSSMLLALLGWRRLRHPAAPTNATSHWLWGEEAYHAHRPTLRHTAIGYATHHASAIFWALMFEGWLSRAAHPSLPAIVRAAAATTATAACVDYLVVPRRLRPGFERHLSIGALCGVFAAIGAGLTAGAILSRRRS
jgi:hypothetical protein